MTTTLMMMDIAASCLLERGTITRIRFRQLRKSGFQALQRLGKQFAFRQSRGVICSSNSAILCNAAGSRSPSLAVRRMLSAIDCTCAELTGSGNVAIAASIATFIMSTVSGGKDAFEKSFIVHFAVRGLKQVKSVGLARIYGNA
jgi:hypothetical protein